MKLDPRYHPEECVSGEDDRYNLSTPFVDVEAQKIIATDGHLLIALPIEVESGEPSRHVGRLELDRARGVPPPPPPEPDAPEPGTPFPSWREVLPAFKHGDEGTIAVALDAEKLLRLARALGADRTQVVLTFKPGPNRHATLNAIRVSKLFADFGELACLMPCRISEDDRG
jgi:hypothetical protein